MLVQNALRDHTLQHVVAVVERFLRGHSAGFDASNGVQQQEGLQEDSRVRFPVYRCEQRAAGHNLRDQLLRTAPTSTKNPQSCMLASHTR